MTLRMQRRWSETDEGGRSIGGLYSLTDPGDGRRYAKVAVADLQPDHARALSNGEAVELEIDPEALITRPKERSAPHEMWPYPKHV